MSTNTPIHVLHVDDEPGFGEMVAEFLEREDDNLIVHTESNTSDGLERLEAGGIDCVVSDYELPERNGLEFLTTVRETDPDIPFILFTGKGSEEIASDAISAGVTDYIQKAGGTGQYTLLAHRVTNAVAQHRSRKEIEASQERLSLFFEQSPLGAIEWNEAFEIVRVNETAEEVLGYDEAELVGESWERLVPASERDDVAELFSELQTGTGAFDTEQRNVTKEGDRIVCEWHHRAVRDELGDVVTMFSKFQDVTDRVQRQEKLAKERAFTEQALDTLDDLFYVIDADGSLSRWNRHLAELTGYDDVDLAALDATELFPEAERSRISDAIERAMDTGSATVEADIRTGNGERVPHEFTGRRLTDPHGEFLGVVGIGRDLSERKEREAELEFVRDLLDKTERIADVGGWEIDTETNDVFWTQHLFEMLGAEYDEAPPLEEALDVYLEADRPRVERAVEGALAAGETFDVEARYRRPDGEVRWFRIQGKPAIEDGEVVTLRGAVQDVTAQKERERELKQARREYEELFDGMNDTGWVLDTDGTILAVNDAAVEMVGSPREEILSRGFHEFDAELSAEAVSALFETMGEDEVRVFETVRETASGERLPVEISSSVVSYRGNAAILSIGRDVSERKQREKQLEEFASVVSHDLRNPLNVAAGNVELAREECDSEHLDSAVRAHERMAALIEDILTLAREGDQVGAYEDVTLSALVERCWETVGTAGASLQVDTDRELRADRSRLRQLVENLVRNAIDHGGDGVTVTVGALPDGFYVADDGPGIGPEHRDQVFDAGYSTTNDGTGFGLSIAKQVADAHGWEIDLVPADGSGARFEITGVDPVE